MPDARRDALTEPVPLHVVTGKGGVGKTTVACALALALAAEGRRVLLAEIEGRPDIAAHFAPATDAPPEPLRHAEVPLVRHESGGVVLGMSIDPRAALLEYLQIAARLGPAAGILERVGALDFATDVAPGLRDVLTVGKVHEAVGRRAKGGRRRGEPVDAVVLDAPPTGRIGRVLGVHTEVSQIARVGPIRAQADAIAAMLRRPSSVVHLVCRLEDLPVQETVEAADELTGLGLRLGSVIVNAAPEPLLSEAHARALWSDDAADLVAGGLAEGGLTPTPAMTGALLTHAREHLAGLERAAALEPRVAQIGRPVTRLPEVAAGVSGADLRLLSELLAEGVLR